MNVARLGNKYLADEEPWKVIKIIQARANTNVCSLANCAGSLCEPFLPFTAKKLSRIKIETVALGAISETDLIPAGHQIGEAELLLQN
jgi:methionyl-tRNA synthetase